jgi:hypothetical protein
MGVISVVKRLCQRIVPRCIYDLNIEVTNNYKCMCTAVTSLVKCLSLQGFLA